MDKQTLKALKGSIMKWEAIVAETGIDNGTDNCPLCRLFYDNFCEGCPVVSKGGRRCSQSPYQEWLDAQPGQTDFPFVANTKPLKRIARAELKFLKGLLP